MMKLEVTEEWCTRMANIEGDSEIGVGKPMDNLIERLRDLDKKGYQPLTGAIGEEAAAELDHRLAEVASLTQQLAAANSRMERVSSALRGVLPFVVTQVIACNGLKCRESVCESCSFEPDVAAQEACDKYAEAQATLSDLPESKKE